jgi:hypothetical protein
MRGKRVRKGAHLVKARGRKRGRKGGLKKSAIKA